MKYSWLIILLFVASVSAEIYRWTDKHGNVIYSDQPHPDAEVIEVKKPFSYKAPPTQNLPGTPEQEEVQGYEISISSPQYDEALWANDGNMPVVVELQPTLNIKAGHKIVTTIDGEVVGEPQIATSFTVPLTERGAHTINVSLVDRSERTLITSESVTFQLHRPSVNNNP